MISPVLPLRNKVICTFFEQKKESFSGLITISKDKERPVSAEIIAIGPEVKNIKIGDIVLFAKYSPHEIYIEEQTFFVLSEDDVLGILLQPEKDKSIMPE